MLPRKTKNSGRFVAIVLLISILLPFLTAEPAHAYSFTHPNTGIGTPDICPDSDGLTKRLVTCLKGTFVTVIHDMIMPFSNMLSKVTSAMCTLAVLAVGWGMAGGRQMPVRDGTTMLFKILIVLMFTSNFNGMFPELLDGMDELVGDVTSYVGFNSGMNCPSAAGEQDPSLIVWDQMDCAIDSLIGGISTDGTTTVKQGLMGFLVTAMFSWPIGPLIALLGVWLIFQVLVAMARAMYIYIMAYLAVSLMILISPIFIPMVLFKGTKGYFEKWLKLTLGFILQPLILFVYLGMMLTAFDVVVYTGEGSIDNVLAPGDDGEQGIGQYLIDSGIYGEESHNSSLLGFDAKRAVNGLGMTEVDTGLAGHIVSQYKKAEADGGDGTTPEGHMDWDKDIFQTVYEMLNYIKMDTPTNGVDWQTLASMNGDSNITDYAVKLILSFLMAGVTAYIFLTLLEFLPYIGSGIASSGDALRIPHLGGGLGGISAPGSNMFQSFKNKTPGAR